MWLLTEPQMAEAGAALASLLKAGDVVSLSGPLGAGKTTLARGVLQALGHEGEVPSPSFALVQPYDALTPPVTHADLYRLERPEELEEIGLDDALGEGVLLVEWPERAGEAAWPQALRLTLSEAVDGRRALTWEMPRAWNERWPPQHFHP